MIAVIADDFTGAAELGGIGLRYGLSVEVCTAVKAATDSDLLIIAADTRSTGEARAVREMEAISKALLLLEPALIFKKTDSVLRGHVMAEINAQLKALRFSRALLVPANPALGRTIRGGLYFLHGKPVHQSSFSIDPEFAIGSSRVQDMLRVKDDAITIRQTGDTLPREGVIVGEVSNKDDVRTWAEGLDYDTLPAGGSGFFAAILDALGVAGSEHASAGRPGGPALFVCGTSFQKSRDAIKAIHDKGGPVSYMPAPIATATEELALTYNDWCAEVLQMMQSGGKAIVAICEEYGDATTVPASVLRKRMAMLVQQVLQGINIKELFIEGGSTAYAALQQAGLHDFRPVQEMAPGVVRMRAPERAGLYVTVKPGSYDWPAAAWPFR